MDRKTAAAKAKALVSQMTLEEKMSQMLYKSLPFPGWESMSTTGGMKPSTVWPGPVRPPASPRPSAWPPCSTTNS